MESSFNIMDDIIEKDRTKLAVANYEAVAIIKTALRKKKVKSTDMKVPTAMKRHCINAYATYKTSVQQAKEEKQRKHEKQLETSVKLLKLERAKRVAKLVKLKNKLAGKEKQPKNKRSASALENGRKWKRIKIM
jgi:hypothetical protein